MNRTARTRFAGQRATAKPARSRSALLQANTDREAVTLALDGLLNGFPKDRQVARLLELARQVTRLLASLTGAACSAVSKGHGASIVAFKSSEAPDA